MPRFSHLLYSAALSAAVASVSLALPAHPHHAATPAAPPPAVPVNAEPNPLLPPQLNLSTLYPDIAAGLKTPAFAPKGIVPLYTQEDWAAYQKLFAADLTDRHRTSAELAAKFIATAEVDKRPGLCRLLLVRAVAISYRNQGGWAEAGRALESFRKKADINDLAQLGALWTLTDTLSRYSTTPKPDRIACSSLASKTNVQLSLMLLDLGQLNAAQSLVKKTIYHEGWIRNDARLRSQIVAARAAVNATAALMETMRGDFNAVVASHDESAAFRIFLFAKFVRPSPQVVNELLTRKNAKEIHDTAAAIDAADRDATATYAAGEALRKAAAALPDGVLKQRTMYAALHYYKIFLRDPANEGERIKQTLSQMQVQNLASDGARGPVAIRPFDPPPPAPTATTRSAGAATPAAPARPAPPRVTEFPVHPAPHDAAPLPGSPSMPGMPPVESPVISGSAGRPVG